MITCVLNTIVKTFLREFFEREDSPEHVWNQAKNGSKKHSPTSERWQKRMQEDSPTSVAYIYLVYHEMCNATDV